MSSKIIKVILFPIKFLAKISPGIYLILGVIAAYFSLLPYGHALNIFGITNISIRKVNNIVNAISSPLTILGIGIALYSIPNQKKQNNQTKPQDFPKKTDENRQFTNNDSNSDRNKNLHIAIVTALAVIIILSIS